jgi:hypothetical protein
MKGRCPLYRISSKSIVSLLRNILSRHLISRFGDIPWPPWSPADLSAPGFFLWGHLKDRVFRTGSQSSKELKYRISQEIDKINRNSHLLQHIMNNSCQRLHRH